MKIRVLLASSLGLALSVSGWLLHRWSAESRPLVLLQEPAGVPVVSSPAFSDWKHLWADNNPEPNLLAQAPTDQCQNQVPLLTATCPSEPAPVEDTGEQQRVVAEPQATKREIKFQMLRMEGLNAQREAAEKFRAGQTEEAVGILSGFLTKLADSNLDPAKQTLLRRSAESKLKQIEILRNQRDGFIQVAQAPGSRCTDSFHPEAEANPPSSQADQPSVSPPSPPEPRLNEIEPARFQSGLQPVSSPTVEGRLDQILTKLEQLEKRLDAIDKRRQADTLEKLERILERVNQLESRLQEAEQGDKTEAASNPFDWLFELFFSGPYYIKTTDPNVRIRELLNESGNLRTIQEEWERIWVTDHPSHLTPNRVDRGAIQ